MSDGAHVRKLADFLLASIVAHPDDVRVEEVDRGKATTLELTLHPDDLAALEADDGRVRDALLTVIDACAYKHRVRLDLEIGVRA